MAFCFVAYSQPKTPVLRIDPGMHTSKGNKISTDSAGKYLLTCSNDKTARFWDVSNGNLLKTFRIPTGGIGEGTLYACSLSPDGRIAAIAGNTGYEWDSSFCIYLINTQTGDIIHRIKGLPFVIQDLEFSPDGDWMAASFDGSYGVYVFDTKGWGYRELKGDYTDAVPNIAFKPGGGLATVCNDGNIRIYDSQFEFIQKETCSQGEGMAISSLAFNPAGNLLAIAYQNIRVIEVRNASTLSLLYEPDVKEVEGRGFNSLCFSADGSKLYGGQWVLETDETKQCISSWDLAGNGNYKGLSLIKNTIADIKPLQDGSMIFLGFDPAEIIVTSSTNNVTWHRQAEKNEYSGINKSHFKINTNGTSIGFTPLNQPAYTFEISQRRLQEEQSIYPSPIEVNAGTRVSNWNRNWNAEINGKQVPKMNGFLQEFLSTDISSDGKLVILSESWHIILLNNNAEIIWIKDLETQPWAVNISSNDKVVAVALGDGTIRWYSMTDGNELLAFYLFPQNKDWVLFTPTGYYDASPGAEDFLGWQLNKNPDEAPGYFPASRFRKQFYRPDIIDSIFATYDEKKAIIAANHRAGTSENPEQKIDIAKKLPPVVSIISPGNSSFVSNDTVSIVFRITSPVNAPAKNIQVLVNGRPTGKDSIVITDTTQEIKVNIPREDCTISLLAGNDNGTSPEANLSLKWKAPEEPIKEVIEKPTLYILAIGIGGYDNESYHLDYAAKDAKDFSSAFQKQKGLLYKDVVDSILTDKEATLTNINKALDWIQDITGKKDVAIIFFSGHGYTNKGVYYMLPVEADIYELRATCLNFSAIKQTQSSIEGKVIIVIDACHSGDLMSAGINGLVNMMTSTGDGGAGAITFTSSTGKEESLEQPDWQNGAFTKALIEGLDSESTVNEDGEITYNSLSLFISRRVKKLTNDKQHPTCVPAPNTPDFPIAKKH